MPRFMQDGSWEQEWKMDRGLQTAMCWSGPQIFQAYKTDGEKFLNTIITGDKTNIQDLIFNRV